MKKLRNSNFFERLEAHPELRERFEEILDIAENSSDKLITADEAEEKTIEEVKKLGLEVMQEWAKGQHEKLVSHVRQENTKAKTRSKKNSAGQPRLEG
jgi:hypothetical protein